MRYLLIAAALTACVSNPPQDPRCPQGWDFDSQVEGDCSPPDGYAGVLWIELGGSGIYGFARADDLCASNAPTCDPLITDQVINVYHYADLTTMGVRSGAVLVGTAMTSEHGLYKLRVQPGDYAVTTVYSGHLFAGEAKVVSNTVALFPFNIQRQ